MTIRFTFFLPYFFYLVIATPLIAQNNLLNNCDSLPPFFQKVIDVTPEDDYAYAVKAIPSGGYIIVGATGNGASHREGLVVKTNTQGEVEWSKIIGINTNLNTDVDEFFDAVELMEGGGYLITGTHRSFNLPNKAIILKLDSIGDIEWTQELNTMNNATTINGGITKMPDNSFFTIGSSIENLVYWEYIIKLDKEGNFIFGKKYKKDNNIITLSSIISPNKNNNFLLYGQIFRRDFTPPFFQLFLAEMDSTGLINNINLYHSDAYEIQGSRLSWEKVNNEILMGGYLNLNSTEENRAAFMIKTDSIGLFLQAHLYRDTSLRTIEGINYIKRLPNERTFITFHDIHSYTLGDAINFIDPDENIVLAELDDNGNVLWNRQYGGAGREPYFVMDITDNGEPIIAASSYSYDTEGSALYLVKTDPSGYAGDCQQAPLDIIVEDLVIEQDTFSLEVEDFGELVPITLPVVDVQVTAVDVCEVSLADAYVAVFETIYHCVDSTLVAVEVCNDGSEMLPALTPVAIYEGNPAEENALLLEVLVLPNVTAVGDCQRVVWALEVLPLQPLYAVVNDDGAHIPPFSLVFDVPLTETRECNYLNNVASLEISPFVTPILDIGNDTIVKQDSTFLIFAGLNFDTYTWSDGSHEPFLVVSDSGTYVVMVVDSCGGLQSDSIHIVFDLGTSIVDVFGKTTGLYVPTAFSPNGDGVNDYFVPMGRREDIHIAHFQVFNRQGLLLHRAIDFAPSDRRAAWDGRMRAEPLETGVYVYAIEVVLENGRVEKFWGTVLLLD